MIRSFRGTIRQAGSIASAMTLMVFSFWMLPALAQDSAQIPELTPEQEAMDALLAARVDVPPLRELPVGFLKITEGQEAGTINVIARCVKTSTLLQAIASLGELSIDIPPDLPTYSTIYEPIKWAQPQLWLERVVGLVQLSINGSTQPAQIVQYRTPYDHYDALLTDGQIRARYMDERVYEGRPGGVEGAIFILNGRYIPGPHEVDYFQDSDGSYSLKVNGHVVNVIRFPESQGATPRMVPIIPLDGQFKDAGELREYIYTVLYPEAVNRIDPDTARTEAEQFLTGQSIILGTGSQSPYAPASNIYIDFNTERGLSEAYPVFPPGYNYETGQLAPLVRATLSPTERLDNTRENWESDLSRTGVIIYDTEGGITSFDGLELMEYFLDLVNKADTSDICLSEALLSEILDGRLAARKLAVGLSKDKEPLRVVIQARIDQLKQGR